MPYGHSMHTLCPHACGCTEVDIDCVHALNLLQCLLHACMPILGLLELGT